MATRSEEQTPKARVYDDRLEGRTREYRLMAQAGTSFSKILEALTTAPAQRFGHAHSGRVGPGMDADLVVLRSDPAADVTALARIVYTIREGQFVFGKP